MPVPSSECSAADSFEVSIIVPAHNAETTLRRALDSLLAQTFTNFEIILIDDASTDGTTALCEQFVAEGHACTFIRNKTNKGIATTRNIGVKAARGAYIGFMDADDWAAPTMFETLYDLAVENCCEVSQIQYVICDDPISITQREADAVRFLTSKEALLEMERLEQFSVWNRLYARALFERAGDVFPDGLTSEDRVGNYLLLSEATKVAVSNRVEYCYLRNLGSLSFCGLDRQGFDLLKADDLIVGYARESGDEDLILQTSRIAAKGPFSLMVRYLRFGVTDDFDDVDATLRQLRSDFDKRYPMLMASDMSTARKLVAWQIRHTPGLLKAEFSLFGMLKGRK